MIGILEFLAAEVRDTAVRVLHADRADHATLDIWYGDGLTGGQSGVRSGLLALNSFVQAVRMQLVARGVPAGRVYSELFSPNDGLL